MTDLTPAALGGIARAKALGAAERKEMATKAAIARWCPNLPKASHKGVVHIGDMELPCFVLDDGRRMLSQRGMTSALGMSRRSVTGGDRLADFSTGRGVSPFVNEALLVAIQNPVRFFGANAGLVYGYEATILADLCDAVLAARKAEALQKQQLHIAEQCEILVRGFARVGIISLVDEATGYQEVRDRTALQAILDKYLEKEFAAWAKRFPDEFYQEIFRLKRWEWRGMKVNRPRVVAHFTNDIVYQRLAPGILEALKRTNPKDENGNRKVKYHQFLTDQIGHPALAQHLHAVISLMRISDKWETFTHHLDRAFPKKGQTLMLPF